jgi:LysR family transcriptional regulator, low CO2-responsive transcriptional regulator
MGRVRSIGSADEAPLRIEWLRSFLAVADEGGFTRAARVIALSQPTVSTHVSDLEAALGVALFERVGPATRLTRSGEAVAGQARRVLQELRDLRAAAHDSEAGVQGPVAIGASTTPGNYLLPRLLGEFERANPRARANLTIGNTGKILDLLRANAVDLAVVGIEPDPGEFVTRAFKRDEIVVFSAKGHPLAGRGKVSLAALAKERFLLREPDSATRRIFETWRGRHGIHPPVMELGSPETVKRAVAAGLGVGILSRFALEGELKLGEVAVLDVPSFPIRRWLYLVRHRQKHVFRTLRSLLDLLEGARGTS